MSARSRMALFPIAAATLALCACAGTRPTPFRQMIIEQRWADAVQSFEGDSATLQGPDALWDAVLLFATPERASYDPSRAVGLLDLFVQRYPGHRRRDSANERLALLREVVALRQELRQLKAIDLSRP